MIIPATKPPEEQVEAELGRERNEAEDEDDREPHPELARALERPLDDAPALRRGATATMPVKTASAMKATRITASWKGWRDVSTSVTSRIGPNSPIAPAPSRSVPNLVRSSPLS